MATTSMNIRTDSAIKKQAEDLFADLGLNMTTAVNMFLRQAIREQSIPFGITKKSPLVQVQDKEITKRLAAIEEFIKTIEASDEEVLDFERVNFSREVDL